MNTKQVTSVFKFYLLSTLFLVLAVSPLHAQTWEINQVERFLKTSIPSVQGSVVSVRDDAIYVELERSGNVPQLPVEIVRKVVSTTDGEQSLRTRVIGTGSVRQQDGDLAQLSVSPAVADRLNRGDRVRVRGFTLFLRDETGSVRSTWNQRLSQLNGIDQIQRGRPTENTSRALVLQITQSQLVLKKPGEWGAIARRNRSEFNETQPETESDQSDPYLERVDRVEKVLNDFNIVTLPDYPNVKLAVLGAKHEVGFSRWKRNKITSLKWHSVSGEVLRIIPLPDRMDGLESFPFLLVKKQSGVISTLYYEYDLTRREMTRQWSYDDTWIDRVGDKLYGWQIGLNEPFKNRGYPVEVNDSSWDWVESDRLNIPRLSVPSSVGLIGSTIYRLNKDGNLDVFRSGDKKFTSSQVFGGHPVNINARRSRISMDRHPGMLAWNTAGNQTRLVLPNNQTEGVPYFKGLQGFNESRLYLMVNRGDYLDTLWESERLPGYVAGIYQGKKTPWVLSVEPSSEVSVIKRLHNTGYSTPNSQ